MSRGTWMLARQSPCLPFRESMIQEGLEISYSTFMLSELVNVNNRNRCVKDKIHTALPHHTLHSVYSDEKCMEAWGPAQVYLVFTSHFTLRSSSSIDFSEYSRYNQLVVTAVESVFLYRCRTPSRDTGLCSACFREYQLFRCSDGSGKSLPTG